MLLQEDRLRVVGQHLARVDAPGKVTGAVQYTSDIRLPGMLHAKLLRSPHPHAIIKSIDTSRAERIPGVKAIISHKDTRSSKFNSSCPPLFNDILPLDQVIFDSKVRFVGDPVAAIAAVDLDTAEEALRRIDVNYQPLPFVLDAEEAMRSGAPRIHDANRNIFSEISQEYGNFEKVIANSDFVFQGRYTTSSIQHCAMEPHVCLSVFDESRKLTVWAATQIPFRLRIWLSRALNLSVGKVRIIRPQVGGGFGSKEEMTVEPYCAALAMRTGKPVKLEYTRDEEFVAGRRRHACAMELKTGVNKDGSITARSMESTVQAGGYASHAPSVLGAIADIFRMMYHAEAIRFAGRCVYTNTTPGGAFRGYGAPQPVFAIERQLDEICHELDYDPVEFRLKNSHHETDTKTGWTITGDPRDCLVIGAEKAGWNNFRSRSTLGDIRRGIGVARYVFPTSQKGIWPETSEAFVIVNEDGSINIVTSAVDLGTGIATGLVQIAAEVLRIDPRNVNVTLESDTDANPFDLGAFGSRVSFVVGGAVKLAAEDTKNKLLTAASKILKTDLADLETEEGYIYSKQNPDRRISYGAVVTSCRYSLDDTTSITGRGVFEPKGNAPTSGAQFAEVEVDVRTGLTKVVRIVAVLDVGKAISSSRIEGQVHGALQMGLGYALSECLVWNAETGEIMNSSFLDYKMFTASDMPKIDVVILESQDPSGPFGIKGVGEQATVPTAAAIANAINDAIGLSIRDLPLTAEKIYRRFHNHRNS